MKVIKPIYNSDYLIELKQNNLNKILKVGYNYEQNFSIINSNIAHVVLNQTDPIKFIVTDEEFNFNKEDKSLITEIPIKEETYKKLYDIRSLFITIVQDRSLPIWKRLLLIKKYANLLNKKIKENTYHKKFINVLYKNMKDKRVLLELEQLPSSIDTKYITFDVIMDFISLKNRYKTLDDVIDLLYQDSSYIEEVDFEFNSRKQFQEIVKNQHELEQIENEWQNFIKDKENMIENYLVYYLFSYFMLNAVHINIEEEINLMIMNISLILYAIELTWYENNKKLSQSKIEEIIIKFTRMLERDKRVEKKLRNSNLIIDLNDLICCSILLK